MDQAVRLANVTPGELEAAHCVLVGKKYPLDWRPTNVPVEISDFVLEADQFVAADGVNGLEFEQLSAYWGSVVGKQGIEIGVWGDAGSGKKYYPHWLITGFAGRAALSSGDERKLTAGNFGASIGGAFERLHHGERS